MMIPETVISIRGINDWTPLSPETRKPPVSYTSAVTFLTSENPSDIDAEGNVVGSLGVNSREFQSIQKGGELIDEIIDLAERFRRPPVTDCLSNPFVVPSAPAQYAGHSAVRSPSD